MHSFNIFVSVGAVLVLIFTMENEVTAAPHPCLWLLDHEFTHPVVTTTTAKPEVVEEFAKLKHKKRNPLGKLMMDLLMSGPSSESQKTHSRNPVEKIISSYVKFLAEIVNMF